MVQHFPELDWFGVKFPACAPPVCSFSFRPCAPPGAKESPWQAQGEQSQAGFESVLARQQLGWSLADHTTEAPTASLAFPNPAPLLCTHTQGKEAQPTGSTFSAGEGVKQSTQAAVAVQPEGPHSTSVSSSAESNS